MQRWVHWASTEVHPQGRARLQRHPGPGPRHPENRPGSDEDGSVEVAARPGSTPGSVEHSVCGTPAEEEAPNPRLFRTAPPSWEEWAGSLEKLGLETVAVCAVDPAGTEWR